MPVLLILIIGRNYNRDNGQLVGDISPIVPRAAVEPRGGRHGDHACYLTARSSAPAPLAEESRPLCR